MQVHWELRACTKVTNWLLGEWSQAQPCLLALLLVDSAMTNSVHAAQGCFRKVIWLGTMPHENMNPEVCVRSEITEHLVSGVLRQEGCRAVRLFRASYEWRLIRLAGPTLRTLKSWGGVSLPCPLCPLTRFFHCLRYYESLLSQKAEIWLFGLYVLPFVFPADEITVSSRVKCLVSAQHSSCFSIHAHILTVLQV